MIALTGGEGFLGGVVAAELLRRDHPFSVVKHSGYDLTTEDGVTGMYEDIQPDIVIHLAAVVGGIGANQEHPGDYFYQNLMMGTQLMEQARLRGVRKFLSVGTVCSYPKYTEVPFREEDLWIGYPEETNAPYGLAKKMLLVQGQAYHRQYGFNAIHLLLANLYGPRDNFHPDTSHVIPALISRCMAAEGTITCWGTGRPTREFLFVRDAARAIVDAMESYSSPEPVNIGTGQEISIRDLAHLIANLTGYAGEIRWDKSKPDGQPRRCLNVDKAKKEFGFEAEVSLEDGLCETVDWARSHLTT